MFFSKKENKNYIGEDFRGNCDKNKVKLAKSIHKQRYQNIIANKVFIEAEEALEVTEALLKSVEDINIEMEKHSEHISKTVNVSAEVGAFSEEVNASVDETMKVIEETLNKAHIGQASVMNVIDSIAVVQNTVENMKNTLSELSDKSNKIKSIVDTIKGIAKTTHLLSLNANIEAARAGEAGRGFSVVAGEVKKLAENSSMSAGEIDNIISEITKVTEDTLCVIMEGISKVIESSKVAEKAGESINHMMESVEKTKNISTQISLAIKDQTDRNQYMISVIDEMVEAAEKVKAFNENISINADRQKATLSTLKGTITNLNHLSAIDKDEDEAKKTTFTLTFPAPKSFDPALITEINDSNIVSPLNLGLVQFGSGTEVIGALAKSWHIENDNITWNFNLRKDLKFHNGRKITAKDVKYTFERLLSKEMNSPNRWFLSVVKGSEEFYRGKANNVEGIKVQGDHNLKIILEYPYGAFINNLGHVCCSILPKEEIHNLSRKPVGAGPYKFMSFDEYKKEIVFEKFDDYNLGEALVDNIKILCDLENSYDEFAKGNLDYLAINASNIDKVKEKGYKTSLSECIGARFIAFNFRRNNPLVHSKEVRQAINYCLDKERVLKEALGGFEVSAKGAFPTSVLKNNSLTGYSRNLNKAKELMRKSGVTANTLTLLVSKSGGNSSFQNKLAKILSENLKELGINIKTYEVEGKDYYADSNFNNVDIFTYGWLGDSGTADNFIEPLIDVNNPSNRNKYNNPILMEMLNEAKKTKNPYKYKELLCKIENKMVEDAPWVFLSNICVSYVFKDDVKGLKVHPLNIIKFADMWKEYTE